MTYLIYPTTGPNHWLENIYRTNIQNAFSRGRWQRFETNKANRPYLMYDAINDVWVRPSHLALNGIIRRIGYSFWNVHAPSCGYNCQCRLVSLSEKQAQDRSRPDKNGDPQGLNKPVDLEKMQPDKGWDYNPGQDVFGGVERAVAARQGKVDAVLLSELDKNIPKITKMHKAIAPYRQGWGENFPKVILNAPLGNAAKHPSYISAKSGDLEAAVILVEDLVTSDAINALKSIIEDKKPLLIPVHAEESISINRIPLVYATTLGRMLNLPVELSIVQSAKVNRTGSDGFSRLAFPPPFSGKPSYSRLCYCF